MYLKTYLAILTTCVLCIVLLMSCTLPPRSGGSVGLNFTEILHDDAAAASGSKEIEDMGDSRDSESSGVAAANGKTGDHQPEDHFDIIQLNQHLQSCIRSDDHEVDLDEYIFVFQQLYKFFIMLGTVFSFVGSDVKTKIEILQGYRVGENAKNYETIERMLQYEKSTGLIISNKDNSGSRTLLRLHRALNFVSKFLSKVDTIKDSEGTSHVCKEAYGETLAKFHPWLIRTGAAVAMYSLPSKKELISRVCDGRLEISDCLRLMHDVISQTETIYNQCQKIYGENDMLDLP